MKAYTKGVTKEQFVNELKTHQKLDNFIRGKYDNGAGKGCAVGCSIMSINKLKGVELSTSNHQLMEEYLGIPEWLARLEDLLFENLSEERSKTWPVEFAEAIPEDADLDQIKTPFLVFILEYNIEQLKQQTSDEYIEQAIAVNEQVIKALLSGDKDKIAAAEAAAWAAAEAAAWAAAWPAAWSAAEAAAEAAVWSAAEAAAYETFADKLLQLVRECK